MKRPYRDYWSDFNNSVFPKLKIVCETENHIGFINIKPKSEYQNNDGYAEIDSELFKLTGNRLSYIQLIEASGITSYVYNRPLSLPLKSDLGWKTSYTLFANNNRAMYIFTDELGKTIQGEDLLKAFAIKYFVDVSDRPLFISGIKSERGEDAGKKLLKTPHHNRYNTPQAAAVNSPIEKLFKEELIKQGIKFEEQVEIVLEGKKFSVPDFVIGSAGLMIYCDGTEFHKDPQRIIMDKQQDRYLQSQGYIVLRFSGSEIFSHVDTCVNEVMQFLKKK